MAPAAPQGNSVPPAVLPGTPKSFPIPPEKLIELAKELLADQQVGRKDPDVLAEDFRFEFPIIKLDKKKYLEAINTFDLNAGFPDLAQYRSSFTVDEFEPNRVWYIQRSTGTHTGVLKVLKLNVKPTGRQYLTPPEAHSLTFNEQGQVTSYTGGYVIDNRIGNTDGLGAIFGLLRFVGVYLPHPQPGTLGWRVGGALDVAVHYAGKAFHFLTLGLFKAGKPKQQ